MSEKIYEVPAEWKQRALVDEAKYRDMYKRSLADPNGFWAKEAKRIHWYRKPTNDQEHLVRSRQRLDQMVRGRRHQRRL